MHVTVHRALYRDTTLKSDPLAPYPWTVADKRTWM
jgi:hypothetical protein